MFIFSSLYLTLSFLTWHSGLYSFFNFGHLKKLLYYYNCFTITIHFIKHSWMNNAVWHNTRLILIHVLNYRRLNLFAVQLLDKVMEQMTAMRSSMQHSSASGSDTSQLLLIVSDAHGLGDRAKLKAAVRRASEAHIFLVFVVLENPGKPVGRDSRYYNVTVTNSFSLL